MEEDQTESLSLERLAGDIRMLSRSLDAEITRYGPMHSFMIRAGFLREILDVVAALSEKAGEPTVPPIPGSGR